MTSWKELPGPARAIGTAISQAVAAAGDQDWEGYQAVAAEQALTAGEQSGQVLGALVRSLLEDQHPDGLDGDDIRVVLGRCYLGAAQWLPVERLDVHTLTAVLASALGIHEPGVTYQEITTASTPGTGDWVDPVVGHAYGAVPAQSAAGTEIHVPSSAEYAWHAPLLIADLLAQGRRPLRGYLDAAFTEIARAETMEMP
jgi:hypothetical protein